MSETLYVSSVLTEPGSFTQGIEGPAVDGEGNVYAVNYERQHTIGKVTPEGVCSVFVELPNGSVGNGIRFDSAGDMLIADYVNHNVLRVNMRTKSISVHAHEPAMNQPNDIAISGDDYVFASDPNWGESTGQIWRIDPNGAVTLLEAGMGTTNGIEVSPDGRTLYVNETVQRRIWAYDLSPDRTVANKRLLIEFPDYGMDGMRCDIDGNLYVTRYGKGTIAILTPGGEVVREVELHGKSCSNLTFGGPDGRTVYVTMADNGNIETFRTDTPGLCWASWRR
ncbi:SMP-30/gluconolactonase/LRE family protein [Paenibacillus contaminans]|uniref:SMP-30/gluconolactonase/LRE family protein n=1 Tax=Paenibacillus contaminans TaxID=450362 RepID=A0A329LN30_9BACL|nr:SMP-30/gluconolactonase/LRE family protein [Paenibacillus contaminans]RAV08640.1 SMP-30/gluconolactonase/LRE family protein [Paenibacillus contaminans]